MKRKMLTAGCIFFALHGFTQTTLFDADWRFHRGGAQRAEMSDYNDSDWRKVDLPHDWSIEDLPNKQTPFDPDAISQASGGFTIGGTGWYRKQFTIPATEKGREVQLLFEGIYMNADVWLNGKLLGKHPYGYTSFWLNITNEIKYGEENLIAVQVKNEGQNSRWYTGSGIYRHVWLKIMEPVHIADWGVAITTPEVNAGGATIVAKSTINNKSAARAGINLVTRFLDAKGTEVAKTTSAQAIEPGKSVTIDQQASIKTPQLWSIETPALYTAVSEVYSDGKLLDKSTTTFGIRTIAFDVTKGFQLNGKTVKLKGGCVHHDNGPLGAKAYDRAEERRIELLKASGYNAIRCAHNPPSPAFLDACDRLGMFVIDEAFDMWRIENNPHDYHLYFDEWWQRDIESMVYRDRNHPSIIMWSIGNEIREMESEPVIAVAKMLGGHIRKIEPTRPVTAAVNGLSPKKDPFFATLDVGGYNYAAGGDHLQESIYLQDHKRSGDRVMWGSESYAMEAFGAWMGVVDHPWVMGDFVWTAFDYIGEASIGWRGYWQESSFYPWNLAYCGDIDICGWKRPQSYYRDVLWKENQLSLFVTPPTPTFPLNPNKQTWSKWEWHDVQADWNWISHEGEPLEVSVYSSCDQAELFLNGKSLGKKKTDRSTEYMAKWTVPYIKGELKAVGYKGSKIITSSMLKTAEEPVALKVTADRAVIKADGGDLSYITVELVDATGRRHPKADNLVKFKVGGAGTLVGVGNGDPMSIESYQQPQRKAWQGRCLLIVKSGTIPGNISITASAEGFPSSTITISAK